MKILTYYIIIIASIILLSCSSKNQVKTDVSVHSEGEHGTKQEPVKEPVTITTQDSVSLAGDYYYVKDEKEKPQPTVVLIHQFKSSQEQWDKSFIDLLSSNGYKVVTYDIRGHGESSKVNYDLSTLLTDPNKAPNDIIAVFKWLKSLTGVDSNRIAVVGTSIGGSLACYAKYFLGAKTIVGISNGRESFEKFVGIDDRMMGRMFPRITSVLLICGSKDGNIAEGEKHIMNMYMGDPKELKIYDSDKHGKYLIEEYPEIYTLIIEWLQKYL
jgi:pimeloyl-ACP methyl ester carboxylesterase